MMKCKSLIYLILGLMTAAVLAAGSSLFFEGPLGEYLVKPESLVMQAELVIFFLWNFFWLSRGAESPCHMRPAEGRGWHRCAGSLASFVVFMWMHQILVPIIVSGIYLCLIIAAGHAMRTVLRMKQEGESIPAVVLIDFLAGYAVWIVLVCILSVFRLGSIQNLRIVVLVWGTAVFIRGFIQKKSVIPMQDVDCSDNWMSQNIWHKFIFAAAVSLFLAAWMIQIGRVNIAMDYDSLHYGLRSAYILDNGKGIYEDLGNINLVYTYSKGFETLTLPLSGTATYGYVLALNLWITALVMAAVYLLAETASGKRAARLALLLAAGVPAVMNMSITAKSDNLTLLFELICLYGFLQCLKRRKESDFLLSLSAYILTFTLKPTAIVFSTVLFAVSSIVLLWKEKALFWKRLSVRKSWWYLFLLTAAAWLGIWARTWKMTGVPITSIFAGLLERIGFHVKEPFAFMSVPASGASLAFTDAVKYFVTRLYGVLLAPVGQDMAHVNIAWGGGMTAFLLCACIILYLVNRNKKQLPGRYLAIVTFAIGLISLISVYLLWQIDGNYYQLFYLLIILLAACALEEEVPEESSVSLSVWRQGIRICLIPLFCFQLLVSSLTNWAGITGMTPIKWKHKGWYNHMESNYQQMCESGNQQIWNLLAMDPATRVLAFGEHPQVLSFPCNIQSYYDVTGSGGNVWLVKKLDYFKDFLRYAKTQYIYVQAGYLEEGSRAEEVVRFMIEDGSLQDIIYENGNLLGRVVLEPGEKPIPNEMLQQELNRYELYAK